ncbi:DUF2637 domain-containing protein [Actinomadura sp. WAC 06369]|uniref:DUF2637 domain-containing protein n=1 Tax=Actinomadura sp. WAC 06369 TaxID=2203193 RepID=UPI000F77B98E|nr:DUF2637 domain-containing protein [Actinomadura sp. WAC 06369]RSN51121.1 hypothetical protein DMH08_31335 [Actinomadura sp. WAC 06369]
MSVTSRVKGLFSRGERRAAGGPYMVNGGEVEPLAPWGPGTDGVREIRHYSARPAGAKSTDKGGRDVLTGSLLWVASLVIAAALVGAGYVAYESQRLFALAHNGGDELRAAITAALPDAGWVAMAVIALVAALRGRSSLRARTGVLIFFALSLGAQVMYAERTAEGILVAVIAPIALAWMLESLVVEVRRWAAERRGLDLDESPILTGLLRGLVAIPLVTARFAARLTLWWVRLAFDRRGTWRGVRDWVLDEAPLAPGRTAASLRAQKAIAQAGDAQAEAQRVMAAAQEEAEKIKAAARDEAEQARAQAAAEIEQARADARARAEQAQAQAEAEVERTRAAAQAEIERAAAAAAEQVDARTASADEQIRRAQQEAEARIAQARAKADTAVEQTRAEARAAVERANENAEDVARQYRVLSAALESLRAEHDLLLRTSSGKARLIALYERLRQTGDPRCGDRDYVAELARELYERAGLASEGTARNYLYEHVSGGTAVNGVVA